jgi:hypothetical protein
MFHGIPLGGISIIFMSIIGLIKGQAVIEPIGERIVDKIPIRVFICRVFYPVTRHIGQQNANMKAFRSVLFPET